MFRSEHLLMPAALGILLVVSGCVNRPPVVNCAAEKTTLTEGDATTIQANATDPNKRDNKILTYSWKADSGKVSGQDGSASFDSSGLAPGKYSVSVEVRDKKHAVPCSVDLTVEKRKLAPTIACQPSSTNVTEGQSTTLRAQASDPNNDPLSYSWTVDGQRVENNQPAFEFGTAGRSIGAHTVRVTATDVDGMTASCDFSVTIDRRPNRNPTVTLSLDKTQVYAGAVINASASASDPDNDPLTYSWTVGGQSRSERAAQLQINTSGMAGGRHSVSVSVRDDREGSASDTKSFSVSEKIIIQMERTRPDNVAKAKLDEIALKLQQNQRLRATITGHTDDRGSERNNERVGQKRADAAKDYLVKQHSIDAGRLDAKSAGESQPIADNKTAQGRKENRRVEVEIFEP